MKYNEMAKQIVEDFEAIHGEGESRGACHTVAQLIADVIPEAKIVCGYVYMPQGRAQHWWVEVKGEIIDPIAEKWLDEPYYHKRVVNETVKHCVCCNKPLVHREVYNETTKQYYCFDCYLRQHFL